MVVPPNRKTNYIHSDTNKHILMKDSHTLIENSSFDHINLKTFSKAEISKQTPFFNAPDNQYKPQHFKTSEKYPTGIALMFTVIPVSINSKTSYIQTTKKIPNVNIQEIITNTTISILM